MAEVDAETLAAEVSSLRAENSSLHETVKSYMAIAAHFGKVNAELRGRLKLYEPVENFNDGGK